MKISDEIRKWCFEDGTEYGGSVTKASFDKLCDLADRIDAEMVELPRDIDGVPIHVGDTVYLDDGEKAKVTRIGIGMIKDSIYTIVYGEHFSLTPEHITHTRPDSWESIADDIEESNGTVFIDSSIICGWADRIRKLAKKEGQR